MELNSVRSLTSFRANEKEKTQQHITNPVYTKQDADAYVSSTKIAAKPVSIFGKLYNKVKETVNSPETKEKINTVKITKLLVSNGSISITEANKYKDLINELAKQDYDKVEKKYKTILKNIQIENHDKNSNAYKEKISIYHIELPLSYKKLEAEDIDAIYQIKRARSDKGDSAKDLSFAYFVQTLKLYDNFDILPASSQKSLMIANGYDFPTYNSLSIEEAQKISEYSPLMKFDYIRDLKSVNSKEDFIAAMDTRRRNIPCKPIPAKTEYFTKNDDIKNLTNALQETDLTKYQKGFGLQYPREEFINDFNSLTENLSNEDKQKVFNHFQFKINTADDIINYPNPNTPDDNIEENLQDVISQGQELINRFMLENKVELNPEDKALETELNKIIKAYPEFISVIGKIQHRGDSIDFHTMDDMKRIVSNPEFNELPESEQKILTTATLFHDLGKVQGEVDDEGHARKSAILAKEIIKKSSLSLDERERVYNLINHSHWLVDGSSNEDIAFCFRRTNDFKMAEIFERADSNSAGFEYKLDPKKISEINKNIEKISSSGNLLFADNLPTQDKFYDRTPSGIKYLDLRNPEMSVEKYGYPAGTKVKDLKFLCHSSSDNIDNFEALCDDSKEVCLSASLLDYRSHFSTNYNGMGSYIINGSNANIILGGKDVSCTGGHRGYNYAKNSMYQQDSTGFITNMKETRNIIPNQIKTGLDLTDEEYTELYTKVCNIQDLKEVQDIQLDSGRIIESSELKAVMYLIQDELVRPKTLSEGGYTNEIVIYNPKIEAQVTKLNPEQIDKFEQKDQVFVIV